MPECEPDQRILTYRKFIDEKLLPQAIEKANNLVPALLKHWPGDEITLTWKSDTATVTQPLVLAGVKMGTSNHPAERIEGGKSERRDGFEQVFAHDADSFKTMIHKNASH